MTNLALIGVGRFGSNYVKVINQLPGMRLKYLCTSNIKAHALYPKYFIVRHYSELLQYKDIDGVIICTPASTHYEIATFFLRNGYNVLIEKPLTTAFRDAKKILAVWKKARVVGMVGHIQLHNPAFIKSKELLPKVGKVHSLELSSGNWGPIRNDVSVLWDYSPHDIAMSMVLMATNPVRVEAFGEKVVNKRSLLNFDRVTIRLIFPNDIVATILNSRISPTKIRRTIIVGEKGSIVFDDVTKQRVAYFSKKGIQHIHERIEEKSIPSISKITPLAFQINVFADSVKSKKQPISDIDLGYRVVKILAAAEKSIQMRKPISLSF